MVLWAFNDVFELFSRIVQQTERAECTSLMFFSPIHRGLEKIHSVKSFNKQWDSVDHHLYNINMKECNFNNYISNELLSGKNLGKLTVSV